MVCGLPGVGTGRLHPISVSRRVRWVGRGSRWIDGMEWNLCSLSGLAGKASKALLVVRTNLMPSHKCRVMFARCIFSNEQKKPNICTKPTSAPHLWEDRTWFRDCAEMREAFEKAKEAVVGIQLYEKRELFLDTDASDYGIGGCPLSSIYPIYLEWGAEAAEVQ